MKNNSKHSLYVGTVLSVLFIICIYAVLQIYEGFPGGSSGKESVCNAGDPGSILGSGRSPGEGNGNPLQYSYLVNSMDRRAWWATVRRGRKELDMNEQLSLFHKPMKLIL